MIEQYEHELMFMYVHTKLLMRGVLIWAGATLVLRLWGQHLFRFENELAIIVVFLVSFPAMAWLVRALCAGAKLPQEQWVSGAASIALPTLFFDSFSTVLFPLVYPNINARFAGIFGAWILWCSAAAFAGVMFGWTRGAD
ncbi:MAG: DUF5367 family protein [Candidatus Acidiferrales bacterium]